MSYGIARAVRVSAPASEAFALLAAPEQMERWRRRVRPHGTGSEITISAVYTLRGLAGALQRVLERGLEKDWTASCAALDDLLATSPRHTLRP